MRVFVYGTLKPGQKYYPSYCQGKTIKEERAWTYGQIFALPAGYPALVAGNGKVEGFLLTFADLSPLKALDSLEGYQSQAREEDNEYQRQKVRVYSPWDVLLGEAWAYLMGVEKVQKLGGILLASGRWDG